MCMTSFKTTSQRFGLSKIVITRGNLCTWAVKLANDPFHLFPPHFHWQRVCHDCVWYNEYFQMKNMSKINNFDLGSYFCLLKSKSILPQRAPFSHAGTHLW